MRVASAAVREASILCQNVASSLSPETLEKQDRSPVTIADFASQAIICRRLMDAFEGDPVIGEEDSQALQSNSATLDRVVAEVRAVEPQATPDEVCSWIDRGAADQFTSRFWTLDPIDGTKGFLRREQYAISLSLLIDGQIVLGILGCPNLSADGKSPGALYWAIRGQGASAVDLAGNLAPRPMSVTATTDSTAARFCESVESGHSSHGVAQVVAAALGIHNESVRLDSQAKYAMVAGGDADIYMRLPTSASYREKIWDHAAGVLLVQEAGGQVTDVHGRPLNFTLGRTLEENQGVLASNGHLHDQLVAAVRAARQAM